MKFYTIDSQGVQVMETINMYCKSISQILYVHVPIKYNRQKFCAMHILVSSNYAMNV